MSVKLLTEHHFEFLSLKGGFTGSYESYTCHNATFSGAGNVCFLRRSCTSEYKHETFRLCSSNLSSKYFLVSHRNFFHFQDG